jgi:penicillin G amidase
MKIFRFTFKWLFRAILAIVVLLASAVLFTFPKTEGELSIASQHLKSQLSIKYDENLIPTIIAGSDTDAAFGTGYVHAQNRLWQLEFNRRTMHGELSEILGEQTLPIDKFIRTLGVMKAAKVQYAGLSADNKLQVDSYVAGINAYIDQSMVVKPAEFWLTSSKPKHWTGEDTLGWSIMMAIDLGGNYTNELFRLSLAKDFDTDKIYDVLPGYDKGKLPIAADFAKLYKDLGVFKKQAAEMLPMPFAHGLEGVGSNNWVVNGTRTKSGKPLLANDPHLGLTSPAIWFFAHIKTPSLDVKGATFPGAPSVILGRNKDIAWGFTNTGPDVQDLFLERINPANSKEYQTPTGFAPFIERVETLKVKGKPDVLLTVLETRHGPVMTEVLGAQTFIDTSKYTLSLQFTALLPQNQSIIASAGLNKARNVTEAREALKSYIAPQQNIVIADRAGNISMVSAGLVPVRHKDNELQGFVPSPGWDAKYDWQGFIPYDALPQSINPANGVIATANQRIHGEDYPHFITHDWTSPYRKDRIDALLAKTEKHDAASFTAVLGDVTSLAAEKLNPYFQKASKQSKHPDAEKARAVIGNFSGVMSADTFAPLIFSAFADQLAQITIVAKLGEARKSVYGRRDYRPAVEGMLERKDTFWCGGDCDVTIVKAFDLALDDLKKRYGDDMSKWNWGEAHRAVSAHNPLSKVPALAKYFNVSVPTGGDTYTVNVGRLDLANTAAPYNNRHAASLRAIYDLENLDKSQFIYQTGQSGNVFSKHYRDMAAKWQRVEFLPLSLNVSDKTASLTLSPK